MCRPYSRRAEQRTDFWKLYHKRMEESGMDIVYYESKGGHEWDFWDEWIKKALDWLPLEEKTEGLNSGNVNV